MYGFCGGRILCYVDIYGFRGGRVLEEIDFGLRGGCIVDYVG